MNEGDFNKNSSISDVKGAIKTAKGAHLKNLRGLLKVIQRSGPYGLLLGVSLELLMLYYSEEVEAEEIKPLLCK